MYIDDLDEEYELLEELKTEQENKQTQVPDFCVDTCVISVLVGYVLGDRKYIEEAFSRNNMENYKKLLELVKYQKINLYIPYKVYRELKLGDKYRDYNIMDFCKYYNIKIVDFYKKDNDTAKKKCLALANKYCTTLTLQEQKEVWKILGDKGFNHNLTKQLFGWNKSNYPSNDAYIMAASTMMGIPLITENVKDFTRYYKPEIIAYKNSQWGLKKSAIPMDIKQTLKYIEEKKVFPSFNSRYNDCIVPYELEAEQEMEK